MRLRLLPLFWVLFVACFQSSTSQAEEIGDWIVTCSDVTNEEATINRCFMEQKLSLTDSNVLVARYSIGYFADNSEHPVLNLTLPLGILLKPGGALQLDDKKPIPFQYDLCDTNGCWGRFTLGPQAIVDLLAAERAVVFFIDSSGKTSSLPIRLNGFADAFERVK